MRRIRTLVCSALVLAFAPLAYAHPGAAIAVDGRGNVYFADTLRGVWKVDAAGALTFVGAPNFHFFALDEQDLFARYRRHTAQDEIRPVERAAAPTLLMSSDFAVVVNNGALYFAPTAEGQPTRLVRSSPDGTTAAVATLPSVRWLNGIAATRDGSIYASVDAGILQIDRAGAVTWFARDVKVPDCHAVESVEAMPVPPYLRGIAIDETDLDSNGAARTIYAAATACGAVAKISRTGTVATILRTNGSWAPTAVAAAAGTVYVLEYDHSVPERSWPPRVRKLDPSGRVTVLATIKR